MDDPLRVLFILGSIRQPSFTKTLALSLGDLLVRDGCAVSFFDPAEIVLPIADPEFHKNPETHPNSDIQSLVATASDADAIVLASPIYHNSFSGVLKNVLDHLAIPQFIYKPVGIVSHGGDRSSQAVDQLRTVVRGLLGVTIPTPICTREADFVSTEGKPRLSSDEIGARMQRVSFELRTFGISCRAMRAVLLKQ